MEGFDQELDARGLDCPLPILRTKKALAAMQPGQVLHVIATDPGSAKDFPAFSKMTGHVLVRTWEEAAEFHFLLEKRRDVPPKV